MAVTEGVHSTNRISVSFLVMFQPGPAMGRSRDPDRVAGWPVSVCMCECVPEAPVPVSIGGKMSEVCPHVCLYVWGAHVHDCEWCNLRVCRRW